MSFKSEFYIKPVLNNEVKQYYKFFKEKQLTKEDLEFHKLISEIKKDKFTTSYLLNQNSLTLLETEKRIILLIQYIFKIKDSKFDLFIKCLNIIYSTSEILRKRISQKEITNLKNNDTENSIPRCSYKFCKFKGDCKFFYSNVKKKCYQDHFVHNMVSVDIKNLSEYIKNRYNMTDTIMINKEILKTINTLTYVITHMYDELNSKCIYMKDEEIKKFHN